MEIRVNAHCKDCNHDAQATELGYYNRVVQCKVRGCKCKHVEVINLPPIGHYFAEVR